MNINAMRHSQCANMGATCKGNDLILPTIDLAYGHQMILYEVLSVIK